MSHPLTGSRIVLVLAFALAAGGQTTPAEAQSRGPAAGGDTSASANIQKARRHYLMGKQAFEEKRFASAFQEFETGYAIAPRAGFLLDMGHAARRMGDRGRALDLYQRFLSADPPEAERRVAVRLITDLRREGPAPPPPSAAVALSTSAGASPLAAAPELVPPPPSSATTLSLVDVASPGDAARDGEGDAGGDRARGRAVYRRWWFWAGAGGVAAGVATAILIGTLVSGSAARDSGTWGQLRL